MTVQSDDGRLKVEKLNTVGHISIHAKGLSEQQVYDALLPLLPSPVPTAREVAEAVRGLRPPWDTSELTSVWDLARRWDEGGQP